MLKRPTTIRYGTRVARVRRVYYDKEGRRRVEDVRQEYFATVTTIGNDNWFAVYEVMDNNCCCLISEVDYRTEVEATARFDNWMKYGHGKVKRPNEVDA